MIFDNGKRYWTYGTGMPVWLCLKPNKMPPYMAILPVHVIKPVQTQYILVHTIPYQNPNENVAWSAKWKVHIWNWHRKGSSRLYTGTLKTPSLQHSNLGRFKTQFAVICHWCNFKNSPQSNREMRAAMPRAGRRPTVALRNLNTKEFLRNPKKS